MAKRRDNNLVAATTPFCRQIQQRIEELLSNPASANTSDLRNDLNILKLYLKQKHWTAMSFDKIQKNINPRFTEQHLMKMTEMFPHEISRCRLREGVFGIKIVED